MVHSGSVGNSFAGSPANGDLHLFDQAVSAGLDWKDTDGTSDLTAAASGDVAQYNGTDWVKQVNIIGPAGADGQDGSPGTAGSDGSPGTDGIRGSLWSVGNSFPGSPINGDSHLFDEAVSSGLDWKDTDGSDIIAAASGDIAQYDGTDWRESSSTSLGLLARTVKMAWMGQAAVALT